MFAAGRIISLIAPTSFGCNSSTLNSIRNFSYLRCKFSLKNLFYTSSTIRCDKPGDAKSVGNKPKSKDKKPTKENERNLASQNASRKRLTAELNAKDYANFKTQKLRKVELYTDKSSPKEKMEAKKALESFTKEIENEVNDKTRLKDTLKSLSVEKPKKPAKGNVKDKLVESARTVASEFGGDAKKTEGEILGYLKTMKNKTDERKVKGGVGAGSEQRVTRSNLRADEGKHFRENRQRFGSERRPYPQDKREQRPQQHPQKTGPFGERNFDRRREPGGEEPESILINFLSTKDHSRFPSLGLFKADFTDTDPKLRIWNELEKLELEVEGTIPPQNYFEELIQWTESGKLWHFPIDNDQGNETEANVDFTEHIFLEEHLEPWCPKKGPLRHFMELVLTGLSKNHYLSVEEKKEHIHWFRDYFEGKKKLLQEMGALDSVKALPESVESESKPENPP